MWHVVWWLTLFVRYPGPPALGQPQLSTHCPGLCCNPCDNCGRASHPTRAAAAQAAVWGRRSERATLQIYSLFHSIVFTRIRRRDQGRASRLQGGLEWHPISFLRPRDFLQFVLGNLSFTAAAPGRFCPCSCYSPCMHGPLGLQSRGRLCPTRAVGVGDSP